MRLFIVLLILVAAAGGSLYLLSEPVTTPANALPEHAPDLENGRVVFFAAGCASCHAAEGATGDDRLVLGGGQEIEAPFGVFRAPNISTDPEHGIGGWSTADFVNAVMLGVSPGGEHYYPAFPYPSYGLADIGDVLDLKAFMDTLPASDNIVEATEVDFPYNQRRLIGLWKRFFMDSDPPGLPTGADEQLERGRYLVAALGHCGQCHTPRTGFLSLDISRWLAGGRSIEGPGWVPNITPSEDGIRDWSENDIAYLLETGFTPDFDSVGGSMASVVRNYAEVPAADREAIAAYLKAVRPRPGKPPRDDDDEGAEPAGGEEAGQGAESGNDSEAAPAASESQ